MQSIYGEAFYESGSLKRYALEFLELLPSEVSCLLSTGSSGCAIASAMLSLSERPLKHVYVRKDGDSAHTSDSIGKEIELGTSCVIVDDLISTGITITRVVKYAKENDLLVVGIIVAQIFSSQTKVVTLDSKILGNPQRW